MKLNWLTGRFWTAIVACSGQIGKKFRPHLDLRDITQQRKLEAQFRQSQRMESIGQLAGGVAHDFNNILAVIQLAGEPAQGRPGLSPGTSRLRRQIEKAAERAANLTRQLLLFSRRQTMQPRDLDLSVAINDLAKMLRRTLGEAIQIQFRFSPQPLFVHADAGMMDQVLINLVVNARDAMPKGGHLVDRRLPRWKSMNRSGRKQSWRVPARLSV